MAGSCHIIVASRVKYFTRKYKFESVGKSGHVGYASSKMAEKVKQKIFIGELTSDSNTYSSVRCTVYVER